PPGAYGGGGVTEPIVADLAVVGLGPAGVAAVVRAVDSGARVVALDEGLGPGGQIWRHQDESADALPASARRWTSRLLALPTSRCRILRRTTVVDAPAPGMLAAVKDDEPLRIQARATILATGARERFLPFPGWTLPGVLGVGGAQALVKSGAVVAGLRVVVAGSGPLLLPVAATWARAGARVVCVAEQAPLARVARFAAALAAHPSKIREALAYRTAFAASPYRLGSWVSEARAATGGTLVVTLADGGRPRDLSCDVLACGFGLLPNLELARLLGCRVDEGAVAVDDQQCTSVSGVFAAGEACGVGGADLALVEGEIAACAAVGKAEGAGRVLAARRRRLRSFARRLERAFALRDEVRSLARPDTLVCRCEDVALSRLRREWTPRQAKLYTRVGMGPCQGRVCGAALETIFGWPPDTVRPPLYPVRLDALKEADA
ncbi:MAG TPA: FAD/NAD(P)-binding oxidoreductase, partial [Vicinamibacteria bacterium]|nr:FAD/NAD(P)-binding oxidoreductase [Vicinamibacteria bacterium]